jgi:3-deoxy-manno-octulosonate cytidylyltransferase (CMP-KDO synthetase)
VAPRAAGHTGSSAGDDAVTELRSQTDASRQTDLGDVTIVIPARLASSRFPEKLLRADSGRPLIEHTVQAAERADVADRVVVAADDQRIVDALRPFGAHAVLTGEHPNGTSRLDEAATLLGLGADDIVINVQGDEPEVEAHVIRAAADALAAAPRDVGMSTVASPFAPGEDPADPNIVKVVRSVAGMAMYFSRSLMPHDRDGASAADAAPSASSNEPHSIAAGEASGRPPRAIPLKHVGLYCYRVWMLRRYTQLEPTPLENAERLEQLRVLEHGLPIAVAVAHAQHHGIDTAEQYAAFVRRTKAATAPQH